MDPQQSAQALASVLDRIDRVARDAPSAAASVSVQSSATQSTPRDREETSETPAEAAEGATAATDSGAAEKPTSTTPSVPGLDMWYEFLDPSSHKLYYYNYATQETTWEKPASFIPHNAYLGDSSHSEWTASSHMYSSRASFNARDGRFVGEDHWDQLGLPLDRSARQLGHYLDLRTLDANREAARSFRQQAAQAFSGQEWKQINAMKKEKKRKRDDWLRNDNG